MLGISILLASEFWTTLSNSWLNAQSRIDAPWGRFPIVSCMVAVHSKRRPHRYIRMNNVAMYYTGNVKAPRPYYGNRAYVL